jgi:hypothetical protein
VNIHYSLEPDDGATGVTRWLVLDIAMPAVLRPLRRLITASFDQENVRTMAALRQYAEAHSTGPRGSPADTMPGEAGTP